MSVSVIKAVKVQLQSSPFRMKLPQSQSAVTPQVDECVSTPVAETPSPEVVVANDVDNDQITEIVSAPSQAETALLEFAQAEADRILQAANQQAAEILRTAQMHGFESGRTEWHAANDSEVKATLLAAERIFEESRLWRSEMLARSDQTVIELVKDVAEKLFGGGFELPAEQLRTVVNRALEQARHLGNPRVHLNPEDLTLLKPLCPPDLVLVPDETILRGGCHLESERGAVDSQISTQLEEIKKTLDNS